MTGARAGRHDENSGFHSAETPRAVHAVGGALIQFLWSQFLWSLDIPSDEMHDFPMLLPNTPLAGDPWKRDKGVIAAGGGMGGTQEKNHRNGFGISGISSAMFACL